MNNTLRKSIQAAALLVMSAAAGFGQYSQPVHDVDNPARQPLKITGTASVQTNTSIITVLQAPAGFATVIDRIQMSCDQAFFVLVEEGLVSGSSLFRLQSTYSTQPQSGFPARMDQELLYYVDAGNKLFFDVFAAGGGITTCSYLVTGYSVKLP